MLESLKYNATGQAVIVDFHAWMDGGSITVQLATVNGDVLNIEFVQKVHTKKVVGQFPPGSAVINSQVVPVRSSLESEMLAVLKNAIVSEQVSVADKQFIEASLEKAIEFVESAAYIDMAKQIGREE